MSHSIAFGWINHDISRAPETNRDRVHRLADRLGYHLVCLVEHSVLRVADQARNTGADLVILPAPDHLDQRFSIPSRPAIIIAAKPVRATRKSLRAGPRTVG